MTVINTTRIAHTSRISNGIRVLTRVVVTKGMCQIRTDRLRLVTTQAIMALLITGMSKTLVVMVQGSSGATSTHKKQNKTKDMISMEVIKHPTNIMIIKIHTTVEHLWVAGTLILTVVVILTTRTLMEVVILTLMLKKLQIRSRVDCPHPANLLNSSKRSKMTCLVCSEVIQSLQGNKISNRTKVICSIS